MSSLYRLPFRYQSLKIIKESSQPAPKKKLSPPIQDHGRSRPVGALYAFLEEEIEASMRLERGVLTLYAVSEKEHPNKVTILEIYADQDAYKAISKRPISRNTNKEHYRWCKSWSW